METRSRDGGTSAGSGKCRPDSPIRFLCRWIPVLTALALLIGAATRLNRVFMSIAPVFWLFRFYIW